MNSFTNEILLSKWMYHSQINNTLYMELESKGYRPISNSDSIGDLTDRVSDLLSHLTNHGLKIPRNTMGYDDHIDDEWGDDGSYYNNNNSSLPYYDYSYDYSIEQSKKSKKKKSKRKKKSRRKTTAVGVVSGVIGAAIGYGLGVF